MQGAGTAIGELPPYFMARAGISQYIRLDIPVHVHHVRYISVLFLWVLLDFYFSMSELLKLELAFSSYVLKKKKILFLQAQVVRVSQTFSTAFKKAQQKKSPYPVKWSLKRNLTVQSILKYIHISLFPTARLSGTDPDDEELEEVEELERLTSLKNQSLWTKIKKVILDLVERVGFFGILVCASVSTVNM